MLFYFELFFEKNEPGIKQIHTKCYGRVATDFNPCFFHFFIVMNPGNCNRSIIVYMIYQLLKIGE